MAGLKKTAEQEQIDTDILIIGGGTAGCMAAVEARRLNPKLKVVIMEKAHIDRSGCLAGGDERHQCLSPSWGNP